MYFKSYPSYQSFGNYGNYEEDADLGHFGRTGSIYTSCTVGSYNGANVPAPAKSDCALEEVCQITFEYRKSPGGPANGRRFYRATCKGQKQCEVSQYLSY